jgi:hypothetical protein
MLLVLAVVLWWAAAEKPQSQMKVRLHSLDSNSGRAVLVLTNETKSPASIVVKDLETLSNGIWTVSAQKDSSGTQMVLLPKSTLSVEVSAPSKLPWRVRFTSIEKKPAIAAVAYRIQFFFQQARRGFDRGWDVVFGEVYHDVDLVSENISTVNGEEGAKD